MAKVTSKGTILKQTIASVLTPVAQLTELEVSGTASGTYNSTSLDTATFETFDLHGFVTPGVVSGTMFYDPTLAGHTALSDLMTGGVSCPFTITYPDASNSVQSFTVTGVEFGSMVQMRDGLKAKFKLTCSGVITWP